MGFGRAAFRRWWASLAEWRFLLGYCRARAWPIAAVVGLGCVQALAAIPALHLMRHAFNEVIPAGRVAPLVITGLLLLGIKLAFSGLALFGRSLSLQLTKGIVGDLRRDLLAALYRLPADRLGRDDAARTQTRVVQETERVDNLLGLVISAVLPAVLASVMLAVVLVSLNAWLVVLLAGLAPSSGAARCWWAAGSSRRHGCSRATSNASARASTSSCGRWTLPGRAASSRPSCTSRPAAWVRSNAAGSAWR
jgi:ABC-type multidrug transport system fused ATPase/permease subunit